MDKFVWNISKKEIIKRTIEKQLKMLVKEKRIFENKVWVCFFLTPYWTKQCAEGNPDHGSMFRSVQVQACKRDKSTPAPYFLCCYFHHLPIYNWFKLEVKSSRMCRNSELGWWNRPELSPFRPAESVLLLSHVGLNILLCKQSKQFNLLLSLEFLEDILCI